jgi:hypothetical protein
LGDKRVCSICGHKKDVKEFHKNKAQPHGRTHYCRSCRVKENAIRWAARLCRSARNRKKLECDITKEDVLEMFEKQGGMCYWYGIPMIPTENFKDPQQPSLDRLDPDKGYVKGNVVLTCLAANFGRNRTDIERFKEFVEVLRKKT